MSFTNGIWLMSKSNILKQLAAQLTEALPAHLGALKKDAEKSCHHLLTQAFDKLELVTREQFDTQTKVLLRTRKQLEELEQKIKILESTLQSRHSKSKRDV